MKQTVTVELEVPEGYKLLAFRPPRKGELFLHFGTQTVAECAEDYQSIHSSYRVIVEKEKPSLKVGEVALLRSLGNAPLLIHYLAAHYVRGISLTGGGDRGDDYCYDVLIPTGLTPEQFYKAKFNTHT